MNDQQLFTKRPKEAGQLPSNEFLRKYHVRFYLNEVIALLVENRSERPLEFIAE